MGLMFSALAYSAGGGVAQRAVRPEVVVFDAPALDQYAGLAQAAEELAVQELAPQSLFRGSGHRHILEHHYLRTPIENTGEK